MLCKWCNEGIDVKEGDQCTFCGTFYGEDNPEPKPVKPPVVAKKAVPVVSKPVVKKPPGRN
jgi:hypothetical protein